MNRTAPIVLIGTVMLVVLAAITWFFVLSPRMGKTAEIAEQTESVEAQTARLENEISRLVAIKKDLPNQIAQFEQLKAEFPTTAEVPALLDQVRDAAARTGVTVQSLETSPPELLVAEAPAVAPTEDGTAPAADATAAPADGSVGVPTTAGNGNLATMPFSMTVTGSFENIKAFLTAIETMQRAWLVDTADAQGGQEGGISLTVSGSMFVLADGGVTVPSSNSSDKA